MLVLLAASRSVKAKAKEKGTQKTKPKTTANNNIQSSGGKTTNAPQRSKGGNSTKAPTPGSAATYLTAMGSKTGGKTGGTGISVVRPSRTGPSRKANANLNGNSRQRSESPPPGVPLQRRGSDDDKMCYGGGGGGGGSNNKSIAGAGASWATQGGSGFRGNSTGRGAGNKGVMTANSRDDFPGLVGTRTGRGGGGGMVSSSVNGLAVARGAGPAPANPRAQQQRALMSEDFPGLPTASVPMPGMERVDWGATASSGGRIGQTSRNGNTLSSVDGGGNDVVSNNNTSSGGKGGKKKAKQKAEKDALKGMAFGFR